MTKKIMDLLKLTEQFISAVTNGRNAAHNETGRAISSFQFVLQDAHEGKYPIPPDQLVEIDNAFSRLSNNDQDCWDSINRLRRQSSTPLSDITSRIEDRAPDIISAANDFAKAITVAGGPYSEADLRALMSSENRTQENSDGFAALGGKADFLAKLCRP